MKHEYGMTEAARVLGVVRSTVIRWVKEGQFKGHQTSSGHNRITRASLIAYMEEHDMPLDYLESSEKKRILIVDDDLSLLAIFQRALANKRDMEFCFACNGFEAGAVLKDFMPHVVVLDIGLPDVDGRKVCEFIRATPEHKQTRIIAISGILREAEINALLETGFDSYLQKPFDVKTLLDEIKQRIVQPRPQVKRRSPSV
jgi:excisionase family DNA binding protein